MTREPQEYDYSENVPIEVGEYEAFFRESTLSLFVHDGELYYTIRADGNNDVVAAHGGVDHVQEVLIEIFNTLE